MKDKTTYNQKWSEDKWAKRNQNSKEEYNPRKLKLKVHFLFEQKGETIKMIIKTS
jgi:hypothetical protein